MKLIKKKSNKRRFVRVKPEKKNPVTVNINGKNFLKILYAHNISEGGISVTVPEKFDGCEINKDVSLVISLPKPIKSSFVVSARIIHVENEKFGVKFLDLKDEHRENLKRYVFHRVQDKSILKKTFKYKLPKKKSNKKGDKRRFVRVNPLRKNPIPININGVNFLKIIYASDISEGGIGIKVPEKFKGCEINKNVSLVITLPKPFKKSFLVTGRIIHVVNEKFGVEFLDLSKENRNILKKYINKRIQDDPKNKKEKKFLKYILFFNVIVGVISFILIGYMMYTSKAENEKKHITMNEKSIVKKIKQKPKKSKARKKKEKESNDIEYQGSKNNQDITNTNTSEYSEDNEFVNISEDLESYNEIDYNNTNVENNEIESNEIESNEIESNEGIENKENFEDTEDINEYDSVFISDIIGKKLKIRGEKWFVFYHNSTVARNEKARDSYLYATNYYIEDKQIIMETSYNEKSIISFSIDNITVGDICSFEKYVDDEKVDVKQSIINKILDAK
ncbi:Type IV pilus assembly PilZ domain protein [Candidatus Magnetomorum sp. HK-1]|nr:Type IV pilus assembly PilZ domain protein [Candidatus Magnetomorum sp. HK-1]